jgi:hypothetical protein
MSNGPQLDGYSCTKAPKGCVRGQCTMCDFYKPVSKPMSPIAVLLVVLFLLVAVPGFMLLCWIFTKTMLVIGLVAILTFFLLASEPSKEAKPCPCCGKSLPTNGHSTCYECRSTQVNHRA